MAELICFIAGGVVGYFVARYQERLARFGNKVKNAAEEELK